MPDPRPAPATSDYRLSPAFGARLVGLLVVALAVVVFIATGVVAVARLHPLVLAPVAVAGLAAVLVAGAAARRTPVVRLDETGYRVRLVRGAGVTQAGWREVEDVVAATRRGIACVELRLSDGRTTTIPVAALEADTGAFVQDLRGRLQRGHGLRPYDGSAPGGGGA